MRMKGESEKACLKLNIQKTNILTSSPITSWKINGGKWKQWHILFTWAPKITEDCDCSHEIKRHLLLGRKVVTNLVCVSHSVMSDSLQPHGLQPASLLCPWNSPGKNTGRGNHSLLQGIFLTQGSSPGLLHCRQILFYLNHQGSP